MKHLKALTFDLDVSTADGETAAPYAVDFGSVTSGSPLMLTSGGVSLTVTVVSVSA